MKSPQLSECYETVRNGMNPRFAQTASAEAEVSVQTKEKKTYQLTFTFCQRNTRPENAYCLNRIIDVCPLF